jgi:Holliday junction resolvase-like predicted endonuclease
MATLNDYRDRAHWSYSALNQFTNICSLQFAFDRIYRMEKTFTPVSLSFGSAFHRAMEWIHLLRKEGKSPQECEVRDLFRDIWSRQVQEDTKIRFDEEISEATCSAQGADLVAAYLNQADPEEQVLAVNEVFAVPLIDAAGNVLEKPLVGEIDCTVRKGGITTLVDWKTSARRWPKGQADKSLQPTAYLYAYRELYGQEVPMRFDVVVKNKTPVVEQHVTTRTVDQFHRMVELVKLAEKMIAAEHFLPSEQGFYCAGCPHQEACRAWHRGAARVSVRMAA